MIIEQIRKTRVEKIIRDESKEAKDAINLITNDDELVQELLLLVSNLTNRDK